MQIATWNVNSIRTRAQQVTQWLNQHPCDVLCLQETKVIDADFPRQPFEELGYHLYFAGQKSYNGVAIFSRSPLDELQIGFSPVLGEEITGDLDEQKRVISGVIEGIRLVNIYVPNGSSIGSEKYEYKLRHLSVLEKYLKVLLNQTPQELCICGDFNIALEDRDIHNPKGKDKEVMASPAERSALLEILNLGFKDAFRKFTQNSGHFTWWDYRQSGFSRNRGWRIDHIYLTNGLYERTSACSIDRSPRQETQPSDHTPVILELS